MAYKDFEDPENIVGTYLPAWARGLRLHSGAKSVQIHDHGAI
jgi:hypothetical protein